ncbi:MAG: MFS transporter, partial [Frankiaceae bacterium]|nr:MFS transporter [Frankiaceae bacterium]
MALGEPPFASARSSLIPDLVGEGRKYAVASTLANTSSQLAVAVGFALGGLVVGAAGTTASLLIDAGTFGASALLAATYFQRRAPADPEPGSFLETITKGLVIVFRDPRLRWLAVSSWLLFGIGVSTEAAAVPYVRSHHGTAAQSGLLLASLPLGLILGGVILGRVFDPRRSERLMLPLALVAPSILILTATNPDPGIAFAIWFAAGLVSSVVMVANRVFVTSVARESRGQAFGIAVAGIAASQGIYALATGILARYVGSADAVSDLALVSFAGLFIVSIPKRYRSDGDAPIISGLTSNPEDLDMPARTRQNEGRVWMLTTILVATAVVSGWALHDRSSYVSIGLPPWWLATLFTIGLAYPLRLRHRQHGWEWSLETVPIALGLIFASPFALLAARALAVILVFAIAFRHRLIRWIFNVGSHVSTTALAIWVFRALAPGGSGAHPRVWPAVFLACFVDDLVSAMLLGIGISISDRTWRVRESLRGAAISAPVTLVMVFLGLATAAALAYDLATAWAITVFVVLSIAGVQTYHRLAERTAALDRLYVVARELGPTTTSPGDLVPALSQLRKILQAGWIELEVEDAQQPGHATVVTVTEHVTGLDSSSVTTRGPKTEDQTRTDKTDGGGLRRRLLRMARVSPGDESTLTTAVSTQDRPTGTLTVGMQADGAHVFDRGDQRLLDAAANQLSAALEKGRLVENLRLAATLDKLTGLANLDSLRSFLDTSLEGVVGGVLILVNIDRFREVNDMLGHEAGDAVLAEVAR